MIRMANIYDTRRYGTIAFFLAAAVLVLVFLYVSNNMVRQLSMQERDRMEIWADATKAIINSPSDTEDYESVRTADLDFLLSIIERNRNIPLLLTDQQDNIIDHRNFDLPEPIDSAAPLYISDKNKEFLQRKFQKLRSSSNVIQIEIAPGLVQNLYYEDSHLLKLLSYYPYVQVLVMLAFVALVYFAVMTTKKAEQNKVWVGLSKETAHQLGTPISSLMAWMELLESTGVDKEITQEMNKDVTRLTTIASRFGKIGSRPAMEPMDVNAVVKDAAQYMSTRISRRIKLCVDCCPEPLEVELCDSLFQWVMENLIKNAVDAMDAEGSITVVTRQEGGMACIDVSDTGKGLPRKRFKTIFNPGYTTKKRGWGLGLALAKRIIEQYHRGRIFVASSEPGQGTTFRILLPLCDE